ncbi:hypothetical protein A2954_06695 [Candidatus Roizmanbacteria bacterium RIFCSPLOWO2_01_FULL_37_12]|uniref:Polymerase beta nucleotidyltransferase domain-containing protein n=1 Tax=Candidatus Roizmanbacteria bacterium RIFCSPLOWO2_01_FULL_37_12 TaxID=1802056 RepID=A0A1F7I970_9BACT|nr:MAG: hypothetical protein A2768_01820 [Candidatus Roizmanbacteria bacterium RIFCSPHIGHO2_01_FULL_37_16]OGK25715.1 MAG: hypothetical protein A3D76_04875 [Candidatus Roizmanbacteria bacterium RIFCSPHIGHO2_02_FULL_37_9b]OGK39918.1 MAG: hypothetical protein A2954_06695 [Candidatus Roizmanbacteria bacterium RIFCSPLOWO2_01_FULL_37_12]
MIDSKTKETIRKIIFRFLDPKKDNVFIFGSRAFGGARKFSDIDIGVESKRKIDLKILSGIKDAFEESDIPYNVDIVDFAQTSKQFKKLAMSEVIKLN